MLYSIIVTDTGRPPIGAEYVLRHAKKFWMGTVVSATPGPPSSMPAWAVTWQVNPERHAEGERLARKVFTLDARATISEALEWHKIDEQHWSEHGYAPNHWRRVDV